MRESHKATVGIVRQAVSQGAGPTGLFVTAVGFFSDFVKPLINLVPYFFVGSLALALVLWFGFIAKGKKAEEIDTIKEILESKFGIAFGVAVISAIFWMVMIPVFALTPKEGVIAMVVPPAGDLQHMMMSRFDKIDSKLDAGFSAVLDKIDSIDKNAGIVSNPTSYNDYYHNAKVYELTGNMLQARQSYEKYFETNLSYFDPFVSYANIVKALEGPSSSQELLAKLRDKYPENPAAALIHAINKTEAADQEFLLNQLASKFPEYGPIFYAQLEFYSYKQNGTLTLAQQKQAQIALDKLQQLEENQNFSKYYIDKEALAAKQEFIKSQQAMASGPYGQMAKNPVDFKYEYVNGNVSLTFIPAELVKKIFYRIDGEGEFKDTGDSGITMAGFSGSLPNYSTIEAVKTGKHIIEIKYIDGKDAESPVAKFDMDITPIKLSYMGYKIVNPYTGKAGAYIYYNFYETADSDVNNVTYSFDKETYDQKGDGMIFLDSLAAGKHTVFVKAKLASGEDYKQSLDVNIN